MPTSPADRTHDSGGTGEFEHIDRLVGPSASDREVEAEARRLAASGREAPEVKFDGRKIEVCETEKTERDRRIIALAAGAADDLMRGYSRERVVDVPNENLFLVESSASDVGGFYDVRRRQLMVVRKPGHDAELAADLFHELVHAKSYNALRTKDADGREVENYRTGLQIVSREGRTHFRELNEAVVQTMTLDFFDRVVDKSDLFRDELLMAGHRDVTPRQREEGSYWTAQQHFQALTRAIWERESERAAAGGEPIFGSEEEVKKIFIRASVTGDLIEAARLVEGVWGPGSFRRLGESLGDFCRENIYKNSDSGSTGLFDGLLERTKQPIREIRRKCSSLINDTDGSLAGSLFRRLKSRLRD